MKLITIFATCLLIFLSLNMLAQKQMKLTSTTTTATFNHSNYTAINVSGDFELILAHNSNSESITIEANTNLMDMVEVSQEGTTLNLKLRSSYGYKGKMILNANIKTAGMINVYKLSGDAIVTVQGPINSSNIDMMLKGDSIIKAEINADDLNLLAKSDSVVELSGTVKNVDARLSSDSVLNASDLAITHTNIDLSGDSEATINSSSTLSAKASGDSVLRYSGNPDVKRSVMTGDSEIHRMN